ncbi:MAG: nucleoside triphosphate pyrophosphatase [Verrucomicrobiota bacterium]
MEERPDLILASASPRRRELLERVGLRLAVCPTEIDETPRPGERPADYVRRIALEKAAAGVATLPITPEGAPPHPPLLAADTTVIVDGATLGKPVDEDDARAMLLRLAGRRHEVTTAYRIVYRGREVDRAVTTVVAVRLLDPREVEAYVAGGEWRGKAGGYAVQGVAAAFVTELRGSLTNVVGLPLAEVLADLRALDALPRYPPERFAAGA